VSSVAQLRAIIQERFPNAIPAAERTVRPAATGIPELDRALPKGGFPLGKLSVCEPMGGATSVLRSACDAAVAEGDRAAWIDGALTIAGASWADGPLLVRPRGDRQAVAAADLLLRSGGFRLVVLAGVAMADADTVRLVRAAHEGSGAFVALTPQAHMAALRLAVRIAPDSWRWGEDPFGHPAAARAVTVRAEVRALGWHKQATFTLPVESHELRLSLEPGLADRRGRAGHGKSGNRRARRRVDPNSLPPRAP
jgi:hypothetical protein